MRATEGARPRAWVSCTYIINQVINYIRSATIILYKILYLDQAIITEGQFTGSVAHGVQQKIIVRLKYPRVINDWEYFFIKLNVNNIYTSDIPLSVAMEFCCKLGLRLLSVTSQQKLQYA